MPNKNAAGGRPYSAVHRAAAAGACLLVVTGTSGCSHPSVQAPEGVPPGGQRAAMASAPAPVPSGPAKANRLLLHEIAWSEPLQATLTIEDPESQLPWVVVVTLDDLSLRGKDLRLYEQALSLRGDPRNGVAVVELHGSALVLVGANDAGEVRAVRVPCSHGFEEVPSICGPVFRCDKDSEDDDFFAMRRPGGLVRAGISDEKDECLNALWGVYGHFLQSVTVPRAPVAGDPAFSDQLACTYADKAKARKAVVTKLSEVASARIRKLLPAAEVRSALKRAAETLGEIEIEVGCVEPRSGAYFVRADAPTGLPGEKSYIGIFEVRGSVVTERYGSNDREGPLAKSTGDLDGDGIADLLVTIEVYGGDELWCGAEIASLSHPKGIAVHGASACAGDTASLPVVKTVMTDKGAVLLRGDDALVLKGGKLVSIGKKSDLHVITVKPVLRSEAERFLRRALSTTLPPMAEEPCEDKERGALFLSMYKDLQSMGVEDLDRLIYSRGLVGLHECSQASLEELSGHKL